MNKPPSSLCVVIVNWERPDDTVQCIRSVCDSNGIRPNILVVDNGSRDDSVRRIARAFPEVKWVRLAQNLGFAGGYNAGIERALASGAESIFLLNNDTIVESGAIRDLLESPWDVAVPKILFDAYPNRIWAAGAQWRRFPPSVLMRGLGVFGQGVPDGAVWDRPVPLEYATGCALMVRRRVFEQVGGFDLDFENYMEDYDFCFRVRRAGFTIGYEPAARIRHKVSQTLGLASPRWWWYMGRNTVLFYRKENRFPSWMLWSYLAWIFPREMIKGNASHLASFWQGVRQGLQLAGAQKQSRNGI